MSLLLDMPFADYLGHHAYGSSDLRAFKSGPPAMVQWRRNNRDMTQTDATRIGSASHCMILTPTLFTHTYVEKPEGMEFRSKEAKAQRDEWIEAGLTILPQDEAKAVAAVTKAFFDKPAASDSLRHARHVEASIFWRCAESGLPCKGRPDWFDDDCVYDLKVSVEATKGFEQLRFRAHSNGWLNQLAHNRAGLQSLGYPVKRGRLVVIAPSPPQEHRVWLLEVREPDMDFLELDNENTRKAMAECARTGVWPGTPDGWTEIELPASAAFTDNDLEGAVEVFDG